MQLHIRAVVLEALDVGGDGFKSDDVLKDFRERLGPGSYVATDVEAKAFLRHMGQELVSGDLLIALLES
jgi:hypothetical protein